MFNVSNKKTINDLAFRQIKADKTRNIFAITAIVLTSVLITTVLTMGISLMDANRQTLMRTNAQRAEISFQYLTENETSLITSHSIISEYGISRIVAMSNWEDSMLEIRTADTNFAEFSFITPTLGRLPINENEVAVKSWMLDKLGLPHETGQAFPLSFVIGDTHHNFELIICGIWDNSYFLQPYGTAIISNMLADRLLVDTNAAHGRTIGEYSGIIQLQANTNGRQSDLERNLDRLILETGIDANLTMPRINFAFANSMLDIQSLAAIALILLIVLISGYLLIYNMFFISVIKDIKHYGLLKTIGTTGQQIKRIVNIQALMFCLIGIPVGLILGYLLSIGLFPLFLSITVFDSSISIIVNPFIFLVAALLSLLTVFISCKHPAKIAGKISPVEATRYTGVNTSQTKKTKRGYDGANVGRMAFSNLFRNKKKAFITIASVSFGLILFNIVFTFTNSFDANKMLQMYIYGDFMIADRTYFNFAEVYSPTHTLTSEIVEEIALLDGVTNVAKVYYAVSHEYGEMPAYQIYGIDDYFFEFLEEAVIMGIFDRDKFFSGRYAVIGSNAQNQLSVGDMVTLNPGADMPGTQYEVMAMIDHSHIFALSARFIFAHGFSVYVPESELASHDSAEILSATIIADNRQLDVLSEQIEAILANVPNLDFRSRTDFITELNNNNNQFMLVGIALCLIVLLIGILNFINTTMTNIISRKYEFAMLQAVGMTIRQCRNILMLEGLYFILIIGVIFISLGYAASFGIVRLLVENTAAYTYRFTMLPLLVSFPPLCLIAIILPPKFFKVIMQKSVVERLREAS